MNSSYTHRPSATAQLSSEKVLSSFSANASASDRISGDSHPPGSMNDTVTVLSLVTDAMKKCSKSRIQIADEMSFLTGTQVTERMLNNFAAESREDARFPSELERAFCTAVGDNRLIVCRAQAHGLHIISADDLSLLELGREHLRQKRAAAAIASLEQRLAGVQL